MNPEMHVRYVAHIYIQRDPGQPFLLFESSAGSRKAANAWIGKQMLFCQKRRLPFRSPAVLATDVVYDLRDTFVPHAARPEPLAYHPVRETPLQGWECQKDWEAYR